MTKEQVLQVVKEYRTYLGQSGDGPQQIDHDLAPTRGEALRHLLFMCDKVEGFVHEADGYMSDRYKQETWDKAMRWLGFMQGTLWSLGIFTLNDLREHNIRPVS